MKDKLTPEDIEHYTNNAKYFVAEAIKLGKDLAEDPNKKERLRSNLCKNCFYTSPSFSGQAFTSSACKICNAVMEFGNTNVDYLCNNCAQINSLCKHCASSIEYKV